MNVIQNIMLDPSTSFGATESNGEAIMNLRIMKGLPGNYFLKFSAQSIQSQKSTVFTLKNRIEKVEVIYDINQTMYVDLLAENQEATDLVRLPRLKVYYNEE